MSSAVVLSGAAELRAASPFVEQPIEPKTNGAAREWSGEEGTAPFANEYVVLEAEAAAVENPELAFFVAELHDESFDEAALELAAELAFEAPASDDELTGELARETMSARSASILGELESRIDGLESELELRNLETTSEEELELVLDELSPSGEHSPAVERFLGSAFKKLKKAAKKAIKKGVRLAKKGVRAIGKVGIKMLMGRLKRVARTVMQRVLQLALKRLPPQLRPVAGKLAAKLGVRKYAALLKGETATEEDETYADVTAVQRELDEVIGEVVFSESEAAAEAALSEYEAAVERQAEAPIEQLETARAHFAMELSALAPGDSARPAVEQFVPAVLAALKLGIRLIGRKRVMNALSGILARLISKLVGPQYSRPLAQAIVKSGFDLMRLETVNDQRDAAASAVVATVEEAAREVASAPDHVLDDPELFEARVLDAFHAAASRNLPPVLPSAAYAARPELKESERGGFWSFGPKGFRKPFKKYSRVLNVSITPQQAQRLRTQGGAALAVLLRDRLGGALAAPLSARAHLYEALPGATLPAMARADAGVSGLSEVAGWRQLLPLTPELAAELLGDAALAGARATKPCRSGLVPSAGRRFVYLEFPRSRMLATGPGECLRLALDLVRGELRLALHMPEAQAQELAVRLREGVPSAYLAQQLCGRVEAGLIDLFEARSSGLSVIDEAMAPSAAMAHALNVLPRAVLSRLRGRVLAWLGGELASSRADLAGDFVTATQDRDFGVTLRATFESPPGIATLRRALRGGEVSLTTDWFADSSPKVSLRVEPGFLHA